MAVGPSADASALMATSAVSKVSGVHYPAGTLGLRSSGTGAPADIKGSDVWRLLADGVGSAELVVDQARAPERAVISSGDATAMRDVTMTVTWVDQTWYFQALTAAVIGAIIAAFALGALWHVRPRRRVHPQPGDGGSTPSVGASTPSQVTT
jgi:hypothetical protein